MKFRFVVLAAIAAVWAGCQCGAPNLCEGIKCVAPLTCDPDLGRCVGGQGGGSGGGIASTGGGSGGGAVGGGGGGSTSSDGGTGGGGSAPAVCTPACTGALVCDKASNTCKTCTVTEGCSGAQPVCDTSGNAGQGRCVTCTSTSCTAPKPFCDQAVLPSGACVGCRNFADCPTFGTTCNVTTHTCEQEDAGSGTGGGSGGSSGTDAGPGTIVVWDDAGMGAHCLPFNPGNKTPCTNECPRGFVCVANYCELRGSGGPVQVTLRFPVSEDLDLHVLEPVDGGSCEIWYGNTNYDAGPPPIPIPFPIPMPASCGALGWLDLDSNPACNLDNVNVENVIYPPSKPATLGIYKVRVDYYQNCSATQPVPYEVEVRAGGSARYYCGSFTPSQADNGSAGSGRNITQFQLK